MHPNWLRRYGRKLLYFAIVMLVITIVLGYWFNWGWVGVGNYFGPNNSTNREFERSKTVWDWLEVIVVPVVLGVGIWWLNDQQAKVNRDIAFQKQLQTIMGQYFDRMTELLFTPGITQSDSDKAKAQVIGRARTLDVLNSLDGKRKGQILLFLQEANLITRIVNEDDSLSPPIISLNKANLAEAELRGINLEQAVLEDLTLNGSNLNNAWLKGCRLIRSTLVGASLRDANLVESFLGQASIQGADFTNAKLNDADLNGCGLEDAILIDAKLKNAKLTWVNLTGAKLMGADMEDAKLMNATLTGVNFQGATMVNVDLSDAVMDDAILDNVNLTGATVSSTQLETVQSYNNATLPEGILDNFGDDNFQDSEL